MFVDHLQLSSSPFPKSSSSSSSASSGSRCPWQGLVGVIWLGPSRLVPSCNLRMWRTTAVALNACYMDREREKERKEKASVSGSFTEGGKKNSKRAYKMCSSSCQSDYCSFGRLLLSLCQDTDLPFTFGEVLLDLSTDRFVDILVQSCVSRDPAKSSRIRQLTGKLSSLIWGNCYSSISNNTKLVLASQMRRSGTFLCITFMTVNETFQSVTFCSGKLHFSLCFDILQAKRLKF